MLYSYIASLVDHLKRGRPFLHNKAVSPRNQPAEERILELPKQDPRRFAYAKGAYRFVGDNSPILSARSSFRSPDVIFREVQLPSAIPNIVSEHHVDVELHRFLVQTFLATVNQVYSILDPQTSFLWDEVNSIEDLSSSQQFILQLVYAISCHCVPGKVYTLLTLATACHGRALQHIETATAEPTIATLQAITLLAVYSLFEPTSGNFSQQIGFAVRLTIDLAVSETFDTPPFLSTLQTTIYCLENLVCSIFVRPTSLQEPTRAITFPVNEPLEFLCSLCRAQARMRTGTLEPHMKETVLNLDPAALGSLPLNVTAVFWQTRLMLDESPNTASHLIEVLSSPKFIPTFLTMHWLNRATCRIVEGYQVANADETQHLLYYYSRAMMCLGALSARWPSAKLFGEDLQARMKESAP